MTKHALIGKTLAVIALLASIAGVTAGAADARPREMNCIYIGKSMESSLEVSWNAYEQGDYAAADSHFEDYVRAKRNFDRYCH